VRGFTGFSAGAGDVAVPAEFFSELLPLIDDPVELKLTLYLLRAQALSESPLSFSLDELRMERDLLRMLATEGPQMSAKMLQGMLEQMTARGTLLQVVVTQKDDAHQRYLVNTAASRQVATDIRAGRLPEEAMAAGPAALRVERPNIFVLYEQNIGMLQPLLVEELKDAEKTYPKEWIEEAFQIAVERNARHWRYVRTILDRWAREGKTDGADQGDTESTRRRYVEGKYGQIIKR
jgi:DNA replication protein